MHSGDDIDDNPRETASEARMNEYLESKRQKYLTRGDSNQRGKVSEELEQMSSRNKERHERKSKKAVWKRKSLKLDKKLKSLNTKKRRYKVKMFKYKERVGVNDAMAREASEYFKDQIAQRDEVLNRLQNPAPRIRYR